MTTEHFNIMFFLDWNHVILFIIAYGLFFFLCIIKTDDEEQYNQQPGARQPSKSPSRWVFLVLYYMHVQGESI